MLNSLNSSKSNTSLDIIQFLVRHNLLTREIKNDVGKAKNKASIFVFLKKLANDGLLRKEIVDAVFCHSDPECLLKNMIYLNENGIWKGLKFLDQLAFFNHENPLSFSKGLIYLTDFDYWGILKQNEKEFFYSHPDPLAFAKEYVRSTISDILNNSPCGIEILQHRQSSLSLIKGLIKLRELWKDLTKYGKEAFLTDSDPLRLSGALIKLKGLWKDLKMLDKIALFNHKNPLSFSEGVVYLESNGLWKNLPEKKKEDFYHHPNPLSFAKEFSHSPTKNTLSESSKPNDKGISVAGSSSSFWTKERNSTAGMRQVVQDSGYHSRRMQSLNCSG